MTAPVRILILTILILEGRHNTLCLAQTPTKSPTDPIQAAMEALDFIAVKRDLTALMTDSKAWWPADYGHYGPFFIRLAWHSAGSYRSSDGRGGVNGGRIRFDPERSWMDNRNLDKALRLLEPIKEKYGLGLSWGDLIILAGDSAIESMGLPLLGFCGGRVDDVNGSASTLLGPTPEQEKNLPCAKPGMCKEPLGPSMVQGIYVNPEGPMATNEPSTSAPDIREVFGRMDMDDSETVALIGGGHAFGKAHGACPNVTVLVPAPHPLETWKGKCGSGKGKDSYTSGLELPWTENPRAWSNEYFNNLKNFKWEKWEGPGKRMQWKVSASQDSPKAPTVDGSGTQDIGMFTSDLALLADPQYSRLVDMFAGDLESLGLAFKNAWYKLTTRDMGPATRCLGQLVPPPQAWQNTLPPPGPEADYIAVQRKLEEELGKDPSLAPQWLRLGWRCAATFRQTDYSGGCDGARIRFDPQNSWSVNKGLLPVAATIAGLEDIRKLFSSTPVSGSMADYIILAATTALKSLGVPTRSFCGGRTDADSDNGASKHLEPKITFTFSDTEFNVKETARLLGLTQREFAVLNAVGYAVGQENCRGVFCKRQEAGSPDAQVTTQFFTKLLDNDWVKMEDGTCTYGTNTAAGLGRLLPSDVVYKGDIELKAIAEELKVLDNSKFLDEVATAWDKLVTQDRYDGPLGNKCR